jgi:hypothetical protein
MKSTDMPGSSVEGQPAQSPQWTLGHLLMAMAFVMPVIAVIGDLKHAGGGALRYALGAPLGLALGTTIVWLTWKSGKTVWLCFSGRSERARRTLAIGLFGLDICALLFGFIGGRALASLLIKLNA